jgi:hypothetical protein
MAIVEKFGLRMLSQRLHVIDRDVGPAEENKIKASLLFPGPAVKPVGVFRAIE